MAGYYEDAGGYRAPYRPGTGPAFETSRAEEPYRGTAQFDTMNMTGPGPHRVPQFETMNMDPPKRVHDPPPPSKFGRDANAEGGTGTTPFRSETWKAQPANDGVGGRMPPWMLITSLCLRVAAALALIVALAVLGSNAKKLSDLGFSSNRIFGATKYALAVAILGTVYSLYEAVSLVVRLVTGHLLWPGKAPLLISYIGDQIVIILLLTGGSAAAVFYYDFIDYISTYASVECNSLDNFCKKGTTGAAMIFIGFCFLAASLGFSSFCFYKKKT